MRLKLKDKQKFEKDDIKEVIRFAFIPIFIEEENTWIWFEKYISIYKYSSFTEEFFTSLNWKFIRKKFYIK